MAEEIRTIPQKDWFRLDEAKAILDAVGIEVCRKTIYNYCGKGVLAGQKVGGKFFISRQSIEELIEVE